MPIIVILFEDGSNVNIAKMMAGSMIMRDFYWKSKETLECVEMGTRNM